MPTTLYIAASLDSYIAGPNGEIDFLDSVNNPEGKEDYGYHAFFASVDIIVQGRKTWDLARSFGEWPYKGKETWVLTRQHDLKPMADERFCEFNPDQWRKLAKTDHVWLLGGGETNKLFLENDLVDTLALSTIPVILGGGLPLFPPSSPRTQWKLKNSVSFESGLVQSTYTLG